MRVDRDDMRKVSGQRSSGMFISMRSKYCIGIDRDDMAASLLIFSLELGIISTNVLFRKF